MSILQMKKRAKNFARHLSTHLAMYPDPTSTASSLEFMARLDGYPDWNTANTRLKASDTSSVGGHPVSKTAPIEVANYGRVKFESPRYGASHLRMWNEALNRNSGLIVVSGTTGCGVNLTMTDLCTCLSEVLGAVSIITANTRHSKNDQNPKIANVMLEEVRDTKAAKSALQALETGNMTVISVHTPWVETIVSLLTSQDIGLILESFLAPGNVSLLVNQTYAKRHCLHCYLKTKDALKTEMRGEIDRAIAFVTDKLKMPTGKLRWRSSEGCSMCQHTRNGYWPTNNDYDSVLVTEMFQPDDHWCQLVVSGKNVDAHSYLRSHSDRNLMSDDMRGKSQLEHALKLALNGEIDIRTCEEKFGPLEKYSTQH